MSSVFNALPKQLHALAFHVFAIFCAFLSIRHSNWLQFFRQPNQSHQCCAIRIEQNKYKKENETWIEGELAIFLVLIKSRRFYSTRFPIELTVCVLDLIHIHISHNRIIDYNWIWCCTLANKAHTSFATVCCSQQFYLSSHTSLLLGWFVLPYIWSIGERQWQRIRLV